MFIIVCPNLERKLDWFFGSLIMYGHILAFVLCIFDSEHGKLIWLDQFIDHESIAFIIMK